MLLAVRDEEIRDERSKDNQVADFPADEDGNGGEVRMQQAFRGKRKGQQQGEQEGPFHERDDAVTRNQRPEKSQV